MSGKKVDLFEQDASGESYADVEFSELDHQTAGELMIQGGMPAGIVADIIRGWDKFPEKHKQDMDIGKRLFDESGGLENPALQKLHDSSINKNMSEEEMNGQE